jgi:hypothetical protein
VFIEPFGVTLILNEANAVVKEIKAQALEESRNIAHVTRDVVVQKIDDMQLV